MYTTSTAFLEALTEAGISHIFANFGSDHPALLEAIAEARASGRPIPTVMTAPNEMVGMCAAHGFAQVSGKPQLVLVHVECGTQSLAGAVHNAARARVPMLVFAGASPFTQDGELTGSRNEFIHWLQDVHDQRGIVRGYMKYDAEIRTGRNVKQMVHRALQFATSAPKGPTYLMGAREVMEEELAASVTIDPKQWKPVDPGALTAKAIARILDGIDKAERPLLVTSFAGRNPNAVGELVRFCERLGIGVQESAPSALNIPHDHPLYLGNQWNEPHQNKALAEADFVLVVDSDVPWIPTINRPAEGAPIVHIDVDPLKEAMPLWYIGAEESVRADAETALAQLNAALDARAIDAKKVAARTAHYSAQSKARRAALAEKETRSEGLITPEFLTATVRKHIDPEETIVLSEGITNYTVIANHMRMTAPGSYFASGGSSLGWSGGAAIGSKLAAPEKTVVALTGDGSYMFSIPSTVHWMAAKYETPFLQVVYNNRGWKAPRFSALAVHPEGYASKANDLDLSFEPSPAYADIAAAAGGAFARKVDRPEDLDAAVKEALHVVQTEKRCAVLDVWLSPV
ncbi:thiamine pyrophosphate-requiring protein [Amorphus sp. 3PC139-8]|uniref:thiamine pyrophosphate-requiring protein n=1 Tax=Amorphus sp. 3PC139-8 TaxID=2735676 RepID=UPI00345E0494